MTIRYLTKYTHSVPTPIPGTITASKSAWEVGPGNQQAERIEQEGQEVRIYTRLGNNIVCVAGGYGLFTDQSQEQGEHNQETKRVNRENGAKGGRAARNPSPGLVGGANDRKPKKGGGNNDAV